MSDHEVKINRKLSSVYSQAGSTSQVQAGRYSAHASDSVLVPSTDSNGVPCTVAVKHGRSRPVERSRPIDWPMIVELADSLTDRHYRFLHPEFSRDEFLQELIVCLANHAAVGESVDGESVAGDSVAMSIVNRWNRQDMPVSASIGEGAIGVTTTRAPSLAREVDGRAALRAVDTLASVDRGVRRALDAVWSPVDVESVDGAGYGKAELRLARNRRQAVHGKALRVCQQLVSEFGIREPLFKAAPARVKTPRKSARKSAPIIIRLIE